MDIPNILLLLVSIITALLSFFVLRAEEKQRFNTVFALFSLSVTFWALGLFLFRVTDNPSSALWFARLFYVAAAGIAAFFLEFSIVFPEEPPRRRRFLLYLPLLILGGLFLFAKGFLIKGIVIQEWGKQVILNSFDYLLYNIYFIGYIAVAYRNLFHSYFFARERLTKVQLKFILLGTFVPYLIGMTTNLFLPWSTYRYVWIGPLVALIMTVAVSYAVSKHHLLNVKVIATEFFSALLVLVLMVRFIVSDSLADFIFNGTILGAAVVVAIFLVRSVWKEVRIREELQRLTLELAEANEELKKFDAAKSEFLSIAGHQLRAPLTVIKGYVSLILEKTLGRVDHAAKEALGKVFISTNQLVKLVSDLLDLSRIESGRIKYEFVPNDFVAAVEQVVKEFEETVRAKGMTMRWENRAGSLAPFIFDKDKMREVVVNLVHNAIKYSPLGSTITVRLEQSGGGGNDRVRFSVTDQGIGLTETDKKKLFLKFGRTEEAQKLDPGGMGIGLYFVKRVVEDHHGTVGVESPGPGKGSTFWVEVPVRWG